MTSILPTRLMPLLIMTCTATLCTASSATAQPAGLNGVYTGMYRCGQDAHRAKLALTVTPGGDLVGHFTTYIPDATGRHAYTFALAGNYLPSSGKFSLRPTQWETPHPPDLVMLGLNGTYESNELTGSFIGASCGGFDLERDAAESANMPSDTAAKLANPAAASPHATSSGAAASSVSGTAVSPAPAASPAPVATSAAHAPSGDSQKQYFCFAFTQMRGTMYVTPVRPAGPDLNALQLAWVRYVQANYIPNVGGQGAQCGVGTFDSMTKVRENEKKQLYPTRVIDVDWSFWGNGGVSLLNTLDRPSGGQSSGTTHHSAADALCARRPNSRASVSEHAQSGDPLEVLRVFRRQLRAIENGSRRDQQIHRRDPIASAFNRG